MSWPYQWSARETGISETSAFGGRNSGKFLKNDVTGAQGHLELVKPNFPWTIRCQRRGYELTPARIRASTGPTKAYGFAVAVMVMGRKGISSVPAFPVSKS